MDPDFLLAHRLADVAGEVALPYFAAGVETSIKPDGTPVSQADLATERALLDVLARERPDDSVLSEESGERAATGAANGRRWILDPIDGTFNFVKGNSRWGTHVALELHGEIVLGVITRPVDGLRWWAMRGQGAWRGPTGAPGSATRLAVSSVADLAQSRVACWAAGDHPSRLDVHLAQSVLVIPASLDNALHVAAGTIEAMVDTVGEVWDHAPAVVIVEEAGGSAWDPDGGKDLRRTLTYTNSLIDEALRELLTPRRY